MKKKISEESPRLEAVLASHRSIAIDAMTDIMMDALTELNEVLNNDLQPDEGWEFDRAVCGFRPEQLEKVYLCGDAERMVHWVSGMAEQERMSLLVAFLNWDKLRMNDFRSRYPNSFTKWMPADDEALLEMYGSGRTWRTMSDHFGRNVNAIKLRLQHLGVDLGAEAAHSRFPSRAIASPRPRETVPENGTPVRDDQNNAIAF